MHRYTVGQRYHPHRTSWPERPDLAITAQGVELRLFLRRPTAREVQAVRTGAAEFAWLAGPDGALLCYRLGDMPWGDVSYHAARGTGDRASLPPERGLLCTVLLVDAATGVLRAIRVVSWPEEAARVVRQTMQAQLRRGYAPEAEAAWIGRLYARYPRTAELVQREPGVVTWTGGQQPAAQGERVRVGRYPEPLPAELARWYTYTPDGGHCIQVVPRSLLAGGEPGEDLLVPAPVRAVLRAGWETRAGYLVADLPYDPELGLITDSDDDEY